MQTLLPLHLVDRGQGDPTLVFLHGFTTDLTDWSPQLNSLSAEFRCVAVDLPGHGKSPAEAAAFPTIESFAAVVNDTLDKLDWKSVVLVGHSLGCRIATETCLQCPDRVLGIAYVEGSMLPTSDPDLAAHRMAQAIDKAGGMEPFVSNLYQHFHVASTPQALREFVSARQPRGQLDFQRNFFVNFVRWETRASRHLAALRVPVLVLQSTVMSPQLERTSLQPGQRTLWMDEVVKNVGDATIEEVLGVGHFTPLEAPDRSTQLICDFVRRWSRASTSAASASC